jgi:hypothetical protein
VRSVRKRPGRFLATWEAKEIAALVDLLDPAAVMTADGGGMAGAALRPVEGGARMAGRLVPLRPEEVELAAATLHDRVRVGAPLLEGRLEPEGGAEVENRLEGLARQYRNGLLTHGRQSGQS